ncbi:hypothetical protein LOTGIDRAFT_167053 [Lottia gigantea]|uniref:Uncharacterized protein n=1 Tax=Lottia gigantea TaxID=225164 RepID=V3ZVB6_LOTGI|nr:hypothetical protein LOTGIDRAFT_167053 [Lottia gigantea]ESO86530.1 hypothetical protein LOTGIDRAFT_167053 [Lottia gigantea]
MATKKCKLLSVCVFILHSISLHVVSSHNFVHQSQYLQEANQPLHANIRHSRHRLKREVTQKTVEKSIQETQQNPIFALRDEVTNPNSRIFLYADSSRQNFFSVDADGNVAVRQGNKLDYEDESMRNIKLFVNATSRRDQSDVIVLDVTIQISNVNDENPVFKNQPFPFLATVPPNAASGVKVYELFAEDPDQNDVIYAFLTGGENRFEVRTKNVFSTALNRNVRVAEILTQGAGNFIKEEYQLVISAADSTNETQVTTATVLVKVGVRPPQFYESSYVGKIPEHSSANQFLQNELKILAKSFQGKEITYQLLKGGNSTQASPYFTIDSTTGVVKTTSTLQSSDLDYDISPKSSRPPKYSLTARATESETGLSSTIDLNVEVIDNNDNSPIFEYSSYQRIIPENYRVNSTILTVKADDDDSGTNAEITYSVSDGNFTVETVSDPVSGIIGHVKNILPLDYDRIVGHMYSFEVYAHDAGSPRRSGTASVRVIVTNVNDEPPEIQIDNSTVYSVREDAEINYVVTFIQAVDLDGDRVSFFFTPDQSTSYIFSIVPQSGLIRLQQKVPSDVNMYVLNITVKDDGSCCGGGTTLSSEANIYVEIVDVNEHKPTFTNCSEYNKASLLENSPSNTPIIKVHAVDEDRGENGRVTYSILRSSTDTTRKFNIDPNTGNITSLIQFDREKTHSHSITIKGNDQANPSLEGYCTFSINIGDVNDNSPVFDQPSYTVNIVQDYEVGRSVANVRAEDADLGINAEIEYSLISNPNDMFRIDIDDGIIYLDKDLGTDTAYQLQVMAKDKGIIPLNANVSVTVKVANITSKPPSWDRNDYDSTPYKVNETVPFGYMIAEFAASSNVDGNPRVLFNLINGDGNAVAVLDPFYLEIQGNKVQLKVNSRLDYNVKPLHELRLRVTNYNFIPSTSEISPKIEVIDMNNKAPYFVGRNQDSSIYPGSVAENMPPGQTVIDVKAYDDDVFPPNNELSFSLVYKEGVSQLFSISKIDDNTARITTTAQFDREQKNFYFIEVKAEDGKASDTPGHTPANTPNSAIATVQVRITDQNDNQPYFEKEMYNATVKEDASIRTSVILVTGKDPDTADSLVYSITGGNTRNAFGVQTKKGIIYVARQLDYESGETEYTLTYMVSDGLYTNTTTVIISVEDVNDNRPEFDQETYTIDDVVEEDESISPNQPRLLTKVIATDADKTRPNQITYSLLGSGTMPGDDQLFRVDPKTGNLYLLRKLDRDLPNGRATYQFNVRAMDEPQNPDTAQYGFASVEVKPKDINDNQPIFTDNLRGSVAEHSEKGEQVMTVIARDYDFRENGTVTYGIAEGPASLSSSIKFSIDNNGLITTNTAPKELDREDVAVYNFKITAHDLGPNANTTTATITITLTDINDHKPEFLEKIYSVTMSEAQEQGEIALVRAKDKDIGENARLTYSLNSAHFAVNVITNEGSITVYKPVDYEDPSQRSFNLSVTVSDPDPSHTDTCYVEVTVEDFNDNAPQFDQASITVNVRENIAVGEKLATFSANDKDSGLNANFTFHIDTTTDRRRQFAIDEVSGEVSVRRGLDRETLPVHEVRILAIDKGDPQQTGTASLTVNLIDINDNYPIFKYDYRPIVMENDPNFPKEVIRVHGKDLDTEKFGPPFGFKSTRCEDGTSRCPCPGRPTCDFFNLTANDAGDGGNGEGVIFTKAEFDREKQKYYYIPIVMWDMRGKGDPNSQTGTNTLTVEIGDINDNPHNPGHKDIFVYNYKGLFGNIPIGNAYAADPDDWDVVDKTFDGPNTYKDLFEVISENGSIILKEKVPEGEYTFTVKVTDNLHQKTVESTVTVVIQMLTEEAVKKSGAMRLTGITAEDFVDREKVDDGNLNSYYDSKSDKFRQLLADKLNTKKEKVEVISVMNNGEFTDVRYSVSGSPYYDASKSDSVISLNRKEFENKVGIKIGMVPIDECMDEKFEGGCYNYLNITEQPAMVNTNSTSFIGVETKVEALEGCRATMYPDEQECSADYCYNGGECVKDDWNTISCPKCPIGYDGPRCQGTHHSFDGKSYSLFKPLEQCLDSQTSIEFITQQADSLIFYNGPIGELGPDDPTDYISLELVKGYPRLRIDHGTGELSLQIDGRDEQGSVKLQRLDDGKWHHIDIIREGRNVQLIVDRCQDISRNNGIGVDDRACRQSGATSNENRLLNVNTLLQLGGRAEDPPPSYPAGITPIRYNGCVKNFIHNGEMYNLHIGGTPGYPSGSNGCKKEEGICGKDLVPVCGENGICISSWSPDDYKCICKTGWRGEKCEKETTVKDLKDMSYIKWKLSDEWFNNITPWKLQMHLQFRTRDENGVLMTVSTAENSKHVILEIENGILQVKYDLGNSNVQILQLYYSPASNGRWHTVELERYGKQFILKMDGGEGRNYNYTLGNPGEYEGINIQRIVFSGASVSETSSISVISPSTDLSDTCLNDVRIENGWFPMEMNENSESKAATLVRDVNLEDDCLRNDCEGVTCTGEFEVCYPLWGIYECRCQDGYKKGPNGKCILIPFCETDPCISGRCNVDKCECFEGWDGKFCEKRDPGSVVAGLSTGAIVAIVVCIFIALILALVVIFLVRFSERPNDSDKYILEVDPDEDIRENVMNYDEEGAGEEDHDAYDISRLRKPDDNMSMGKSPLDPIPRTRMVGLGRAPRPGEDPDVGGFIDDRLGDADDDPNGPPPDSVCEYAYEGGGSDAGSLSSLNTTSSDGDQDYDYLNDWGPKFAKLADMYGAGQED